MPLIEVHSGQVSTSGAGVVNRAVGQSRVRPQHHLRLYLGDAVGVITNDSRQSGVAQSLQLAQAEARSLLVGLEPEPVPAPQSAEAISKNARERSAEATSVRGAFEDSADEQIDVVDGPVGALQSRPSVAVDGVVQAVESPSSGQAARFAESVVSRQAMLPAALNVDRHQVSDFASLGNHVVENGVREKPGKRGRSRKYKHWKYLIKEAAEYKLWGKPVKVAALKNINSEEKNW